MKLVLAASFIGIAVALACGGGGGGDAASAVRPFSEVQASEFVFESDPNVPGRGIFRVTTTEPMICAIVWGETEALGRINNSLDMKGTGIIEHDVFLPGAVSGREYFFTVQGSTADGTLFQSALASFRLPVPDSPAAMDTPSQATGTDLRELATVAEVSSEFGAFWAGANVLDGDLSTEWSSAGDGDDAYITIDLGQMREVAAFEFITRSMADGSATTLAYSVVVDGGERYGPFEAGTPAVPALQSLLFEGRFLRFEMEATTGGNTGAMEIRLYAPAE